MGSLQKSPELKAQFKIYYASFLKVSQKEPGKTSIWLSYQHSQLETVGKATGAEGHY
jgi:hypothetical protein